MQDIVLRIFCKGWFLLRGNGASFAVRNGLEMISDLLDAAIV